MATGTEVGSVYLRLALESDVNQQVQQATDEVGKTASTSFGNMFKKAFSVAAVAAAINALKNFSNEAINLYHIQEDAEIKLETVMKQRMNATDTQIQQIKDAASALQEVGVVGDEVTLSGAQQLASFVNSAEAVEALLPAMDNLLVQQKGLNATAGDAVTIGTQFGKIMQGNTALLGRLGIEYSEAQEEILKYGTEEERAATLAELITKRTGEMNKALAATDSGKIQQLEMSLGDVKEEFGEAFQELKVAFLPAMTEFVKLLADLAVKFQQITGEITKFTNAVGWTKSEFADSLTGDAKSQYDDLIAQRNNILSQIQALSSDEIEEVGEEVAEAVTETKTTDNSNPSASFDQFNILRFKDATKNLLDASETLENAATDMGIDLSDTPDKDQIEDLQKLLQDIDKQIAELYNDNTYSEETVDTINNYEQDFQANASLSDKIDRWMNKETEEYRIMDDSVSDWINKYADTATKEIFNRYYDPSTQILNTSEMSTEEYGALEKLLTEQLPVAEDSRNWLQKIHDEDVKQNTYDTITLHLSEQEVEEMSKIGNLMDDLLNKYYNREEGTVKFSDMKYSEFQYFYDRWQNTSRGTDSVYDHDSSNSYFKVKVPGYASGGVAYQPELAIVGDHKSGGGEIIAPENLMRQIIKEELGRNSQTINLTAPIYIDGDYITDANIRNINTQTQLRGKQQIR